MKAPVKPRCREMGDTREAAAIAAKHHEGLYRWALWLSGGSRDEADDVVQATYFEIIEGRADLTSASNPRAFLFGTARRIAASRRRRSFWRRIVALDVEMASGASTGRDPEGEFQSGESSTRVREALAALGGRQGAVAVLVFAYDLTVEESARVMGVSVGAARKHYHRAKEKLARMLEEEHVDDRQSLETAGS